MRRSRFRGRPRLVSHTAAACAALLAVQPITATAQTVDPAPASHAALGKVQALSGAMPSAFDIYPGDACAGAWQISDPAGRLVVTVIRYAGLPVAHVTYPSGASLNLVVQRLAAHTIEFDLYAARYTMQCTAGGAMVDRARGHDHQPLAIAAAPLDMPPAPPSAPAASVAPPALPRACDDPAALQSLRQRENVELRRKGTMITLVTVLNPSTLHHSDAESSCMAVAAFSEGTRLPITYTMSPGEMSWNVGTSDTVPIVNPLLGNWVGVNSDCVGARWTFLPTSLTIYPVPHDPRKPKTFDKVSYNVRDNSIVDVQVDGRRNSELLVKDGRFVNGTCLFRHE